MSAFLFVAVGIVVLVVGTLSTSLAYLHGWVGDHQASLGTLTPSSWTTGLSFKLTETLGPQVERGANAYVQALWIPSITSSSR